MLYQHANSYDINLNNYSNLVKIKSSLELSENINFNLARSELDSISQDLSRRINSLPLDNKSKTQVTDIIARKKNELSETNFARFMLNFSNRIGDVQGSFDELQKFTEYGEDSQNIDFAELSREINELSYTIKIHMSGNDKERMLIEYDHYLSRLQHILFLEAVRADAQNFIADNKESWNKLINFFRNECENNNITFTEPDFAMIEKSIHTAYSFYTGAIERDKALVDNLLANMSPGDSAVLVAGGFHEQGIIQILKDSHVNFVAVNPFISSSEPDIAYLDKMSGNLFPSAPETTSNITVSMLYTELFDNYPKLTQLFTRQTLRRTVDMIISGEQSVERIIYNLYDNYELPFPSESFAKQFTDRLQPALNELRALTKSSDTNVADIATYLEDRIIYSISQQEDQRLSRGLPAPSKDLAVSVVVPVYDELHNGNILTQIESFINQDADPQSFELIFIVNNSFDDAQDKTPAFEDNQQLLEIGKYLNAPQGTPQPEFFKNLSAREQSIIAEAKRTGLNIHFLDRSTQGVPGVVEKHGVRIGTLRNIGVFTAIDRFESIERNGFIANLDADTTAPNDYISRLIQYSSQDNVDVVYTNLDYEYVGGTEFLFKTHFIQASYILSSRFPEYIVAKAPQDVGTVRIIARSELFKKRGGFPDLTTGEDIFFTRLMQRTSYGLFSSPDLTVTTQDRMREQGFDSDMRNRLGQSMSPNEFIMQHSLAQHSSVRIEFLKRFIRERSRTPISAEEFEDILKFYGFDITPDDPAWAEFIAGGSVHQFVYSLDQNNKYYLPNVDDNIMDFSEKLLRNISQHEYEMFQQILNNEIKRENKDILQFQEELKEIYDTIWDDPEKDSISTDKIASIINSIASHQVLKILAGENWFLEKLQQIGQETYKENYYNTLLREFRDWANPIDNTKRNVFRKGQAYQRAFNILLQKGIHFPEEFPEFHAFLTKITGHDYLIISPQSATDELQPQPETKTKFAGQKLLESSL